MIKTLDRYILQSFLQSVLLWFIVLISLRVVADVFINIDEFMENIEQSRAAGGLGLVQMIASYYFFKVFVYFKEMGGLIIVAGAAFTVARMNHTNELTAILASGVSLHRVVWPILLCSILLQGFVVIDQEFILPNVRDKLIIGADEQVNRENFQVRFLTDGDQSVWWSANYNPNTQTLLYPLVILRDSRYGYLADFCGRAASPGRYGDQNGWVVEDAELRRRKGRDLEPWRTTQRTDRIFTTVGPEIFVRNARDAYRKSSGRDIPAGTRIEEWERCSGFDPHFNMRLTAQTFVPRQWVGDQAVTGSLFRPRFEFLGPEDRVLAVIFADRADWVPGGLHECYWKLRNGRLFHATDLNKDDLELRQNNKWMDYLSSSELTALLRLRNVTDVRAVRMTKYLRFAEPLDNLAMLLLALPFILSRQRNLKASVFLCVLVVGGFYVFVYLCRYVGLPDFLGAFLPLLLLGPVSVLTLDAIKT